MHHADGVLGIKESSSKKEEEDNEDSHGFKYTVKSVESVKSVKSVRGVRYAVRGSLIDIRESRPPSREPFYL